MNFNKFWWYYGPMIGGIMLALGLAFLVGRAIVQEARELEKESQAMAKCQWTVTKTIAHIARDEYGVNVPRSKIAIWMKPIGLTKLKNEVSIFADVSCPQLDLYLKIKPGDQLYFLRNEHNSDNLQGDTRFSTFTLWTAVSKDLQKILPGDWRRHPEYKQFNFEDYYKNHPR